MSDAKKISPLARRV